MDKTLARLDTPYIDLLLIHQPADNYVDGYRIEKPRNNLKSAVITEYKTGSASI